MEVNFDILSLIAGILLFDWLRLRLKEFAVKDQHSFKSTRYKCLILLLIALLKDDIENIRTRRPEIKTKEELIKEIETEVYNAQLFSTKNTIKLIKEFTKVPNEINLEKAIRSMKRELW
ncbi:MAG: hypothetical protein HRT47_04615 [Candidatus Caenarcaniphilales bacterium]|nr:hypothetical protein [Candidatus Caenarcaniphilales bacterium]